MQAIRGQLLVHWLIFNAAQLNEFLMKLQIPAAEEVPELTMSKAVEESYAVIYHVM